MSYALGIWGGIVALFILGCLLGSSGTGSCLSDREGANIVILNIIFFVPTMIAAVVVSLPAHRTAKYFTGMTIAAFLLPLAAGALGYYIVGAMIFVLQLFHVPLTIFTLPAVPLQQFFHDDEAPASIVLFLLFNVFTWSFLVLPLAIAPKLSGKFRIFLFIFFLIIAALSVRSCATLEAPHFSGF